MCPASIEKPMPAIAIIAIPVASDPVSKLAIQLAALAKVLFSDMAMDRIDMTAVSTSRSCDAMPIWLAALGVATQLQH